MWTTDYLIDTARHLAELRRRFPGNRDFSDAVHAAGLAGINHRDRAALIRISEWPEDYVRELHRRAGNKAPQHFLHNHLTRNLPVADDSGKMISPTSGKTQPPGLGKTEVTDAGKTERLAEIADRIRAAQAEINESHRQMTAGLRKAFYAMDEVLAERGTEGFVKWWHDDRINETTGSSDEDRDAMIAMIEAGEDVFDLMLGITDVRVPRHLISGGFLEAAKAANGVLQKYWGEELLAGNTPGNTEDSL